MNANVSSNEPAVDTSPESTLRLTSVISVPSDLYAGKPLAKYTISAGFSRRPNSAESRIIAGPASLERLAEKGYAEVKLAIDDLRLDIQNTSLEELKSGLASVVGALVRESSAQARQDREQRDADALVKSQADEVRRREIDDLAHRISFD